MNNGSAAAAPLSGFLSTSGEVVCMGMYDPDVSGLTKREAFAMTAMQGLLAGAVHSRLSRIDYARIAVSQADALLDALEVGDE